MKHTLLAAALIAATLVPTYAQEPAKVPFMDTSRPTKIVEAGVNVGVGASSMIQNYRTVIPGLSDFTFTPGVMVSFGADVKLPIRNYLAVGTALNFNINNYFWTMTILDPQAGTLNNLSSRHHFYDLDIPIYLDLRFNISRNVRWENEIGWYLSVGLGGKTRTRSYSSSTNSLGQSQVTETYYKRDYYNDKGAIVNGISSTDWGLHLATGLTVSRHLSIKAVMHAGARDVSRNFGVLNIHNHTLNASFKVGYIF